MRSPFGIIKRHLLSPVIQFGPPRTGSTLVWNALRVSLPDLEIPKRHTLSFLHLSPLCRAKIVCTVRNPLDIIASMLSISDLSPTPATVASKIRDIQCQGIKEALAIRTRPGTLFLRYEDFHADFDLLFGKISNFLNVEISPEVRNQFDSDFNLVAVRQRAEKMETFDRFDPVDFIHGKHISQNSGRPGYHAEILDAASIEDVRSAFREFRLAFNY